MTTDQKRLERSLIVVLLVVAAAIRLALISSSRFTGDEALFYQMAVHIRNGIEFPILGPPVSGGTARHPGPLFYYLMSLSQFIWKSPESANAEIALLGAASIGLVWSAVRSVLGFFPAFVVALLMTFAPWTVLYADRIWSPNAVITLVCIAFWAAVKVYQTPKTRWIALLVAVCAIMPQFHLSSPVVWIAFVAMIAPKWKQLNWKWLGVGIFFAILAYVPCLVYELQNDFANFKALRAENIHSSGEIKSYEAIFYAFRFLTLDTTYHELMGYWGSLSEYPMLQALYTGTPIRPFNILRFFALICSIVLAAMIYFTAIKDRKYLGIFWRGFWVGMVADIALMTYTRKPFYPHYLTLMLPFIFSLAAALAHRMQKNARMKKLCIVLIGIFCIGGLEASLSISRNLDLRNGLATQRRVIELMLSDAKAQNWPAGTQIGLRLGFPGFIDGYPVLMKESYESDYTIAGNPGPNGPYYYLLQLPVGTQDPRGRSIGEDGLYLFRVQ